MWLRISWRWNWVHKSADDEEMQMVLASPASLFSTDAPQLYGNSMFLVIQVVSNENSEEFYKL